MTYRNFPYPLFDRYDMPENVESCPRRDVTTVAPQVLWTLNSHVSFDEAQQFAARLVKESGDNPRFGLIRRGTLPWPAPPAPKKRPRP